MTLTTLAAINLATRFGKVPKFGQIILALERSSLETFPKERHVFLLSAGGSKRSADTRAADTAMEEQGQEARTWDKSVQGEPRLACRGSRIHERSTGAD